jgi:hypothetical protein
LHCTLQVLSLLATLRQDNTVVNNLLIEDDLVGTAFPALQVRPHPIPPFSDRTT